MKKILAGVLAAASMLTMTVGASAADNEKSVTKAGEVTYEVAIAPEKVTLNLIMPAKISAALNPYGAEIKLGTGTSGDVATTTGIASVAYPFKNKSTDYGVWVDATAITTVSSKDWNVSSCADDDTTKSAELYLVAANDVDELKGFADDLKTITEGKATDNSGKAKQGALKLDSTVEANKATGVAAGQTNQKKMMFVAANDKTNDGEAVLAFLGNVETGDDIEWTEEDTINVNLVLKVSAGAKTIDGAASSGNGGGGASFTDPADLTGAITAGTGSSKVVRTGDTAYTAEVSLASVGAATPVATVFTIPLATGKQILSVQSSDTNVVASAGVNIMVKANSGTSTLTIKTSSDGMTDDGQTITIVVTATA